LITLTVLAPSREYEVAIGRRAAELLPRAAGSGAAAVVTDSNTGPLYAERVLTLLRGAGIRAFETRLPAGEEHKTPDAVLRLCREFAAAGLLRRDCVIALGGGVVGDVAGFAAASYMRGARFIQVPTTLIAMTDSSVGGKTGVNLPEGKNLMGAFYQPEGVIIDTAFLQTLPERETRAGLAEVVKYYALGERGIERLLRNGGILPGAEEELIYLCCRLKADVVASDERESGARRTLNFGHTFGHALEKYYSYARYNHGEAVAVGMRLALETGEKLGITPANVTREVLGAMAKAGLDTSLDLPPRELVRHMSGDKKRTGEGVALVLLRDIGDAGVFELDMKELEELL
jgi:3-dehydroquinate synthase